MTRNTTEILVGAAVLAVAAAFMLYVSQVSGIGGRGAGYPLVASFRSADGINPGTDVRLAGVKVGSVSSIELDPQSFRANAHFSVRDGVEVPDDSQIVISSEGLLGGNFLEILPGGSPFSYAAGDEILDTQGSVSLISLLMRFVGSGAGEGAAQ